MAVIPFVTLQEIRGEAGIQQLKMAESANPATGDGSNTHFYTTRKPLATRTRLEEVAVTDVVAYVNGVAVTISSIDELSGAVILASPPANGARVTFDYAHSSISQADMASLRAEGMDWLRNKVKSYIDFDALVQAPATPTFPATFITIVRLYVAGLILIRDYGSGADTDLTSKDGYAKIKFAKSMLSDWLADFQDDSDALNTIVPTSQTDGNIFYRDEDLGNGRRRIRSDDDKFFHNGY